MFFKKKGPTLAFLSFLQAFGIVVYCASVASLLWNGQKLFGSVPNYFGPFLALMLFSTSALICALIVGYQPFLLWQEKKVKEAAKLVIYTAAWLLGFTFFILLMFILIPMWMV